MIELTGMFRAGIIFKYPDSPGDSYMVCDFCAEFKERFVAIQIGKLKHLCVCSDCKPVFISFLDRQLPQPKIVSQKG